MTQSFLIIGLELERENQLRQERSRSPLTVPFTFRRTGQGGLRYLRAVNGINTLRHSSPLLLIVDWCLSDMPAFLFVKKVRTEPLFRDLFIIACHDQWCLPDRRTAYSFGVDTCVACPENFSGLLACLHRIEKRALSELRGEMQFVSRS